MGNSHYIDFTKESIIALNDGDKTAAVLPALYHREHSYWTSVKRGYLLWVKEPMISVEREFLAEPHYLLASDGYDYLLYQADNVPVYATIPIHRGEPVKSGPKIALNKNQKIYPAHMMKRNLSRITLRVEFVVPSRKMSEFDEYDFLSLGMSNDVHQLEENESLESRFQRHVIQEHGAEFWERQEPVVFIQFTVHGMNIDEYLYKNRDKLHA